MLGSGLENLVFHSSIEKLGHGLDGSTLINQQMGLNYNGSGDFL
jgi:hypothetical protein